MWGELAVSSMKRWNFYTLITFLKVRKRHFKVFLYVLVKKEGSRESREVAQVFGNRGEDCPGQGSPWQLAGLALFCQLQGPQTGLGGCTAASICCSTASTMGTIMAVVAVLLIHMERKAWRHKASISLQRRGREESREFPTPSHPQPLGE